VELLVVDAAADAYFDERGVQVSVSMEESAVQRIVCPSTNVYAGASTSSPPAPVSSAARNSYCLIINCSNAGWSSIYDRGVAPSPRKLRSELGR